MSCARGCCPSPREHYRSLSFYATGAGTVHEADRRLARDLAAYARLRRDGVQPRSTTGAARVEATANTPWQVESRPRGIDE